MLSIKNLFNIKNYSPEVSNIQRREVELNIILPRVNNFDVKQKSAWNNCFIIYPKHQTKILGECLEGKVNFNDIQLSFFFQKKISYNISNDIIQEQLI